MSIESDEYQKDNKVTGEISQNPLIKGFLDNDQYYALYEKARLFPSKENREIVEEEFKNYYEKIRRDTYFKNLIRYYAIDYDKRVRKMNSRFPLTLDQSISTDEGLDTLKSLLEGETDITNEKTTLKDEISNELLFQALDTLTETQYKILDLIYVKNLNRTEIASLVDSTPQNISQIHRKAIKKLKSVGDDIGGRR